MLTRPKKNFEAEAEATMYEAEAEAELHKQVYSM